MIEIEMNTEDKSMFLLTETHKRDGSIREGSDKEIIHKTRRKESKKGGGIMAIWNKNEWKVQELKSKNEDILIIEVNKGKEKHIIATIYLSVNDTDKNKKLTNEIKEITEKYKDEKLIVMGDFNAHIGIIGEQSLNQNGRLIRKLMECSDLILLNIDENKTKGKITWRQGGHESVIDFVFCNEKMYNNVESIEIDEAREIMDISDHNLINIKIKTEETTKKTRSIEKEINYYKLTEDRMINMKNEVKKIILEEDIQTMESLEHKVKEQCDRTLKVTKRIKKNQNKDKPWCNNKIKKEIGNKREISKRLRKEENYHKKEDIRRELKDKKKKISGMVREEVTKYENQIVNKIKTNQNPNKKMSEHIKEIKGEKREETKIEIYRDTGEKVEEEELKKELKEIWKKTMAKEDNKSEEGWNRETKQEYINRLEQEIDSIDRRRNMENNDEGRNETQMRKIIINNAMIEKQIKKMKEGKAPGPDGIRNEIYKGLIKDRSILNKLTQLYNKVLVTGNIPKTWRESKTILIPKKVNPTVKDLRPIALTNTTYKIFMNILKDEIYEHMRINKLIKDTQTGSARGRRVQDNVKILDYCVESTYRRKEIMYALAIDFAKAFDSIDRKRMIEILKKYKIHPNVIEVIFQVYREDWTELIMNGEEMGKINISNGIRQGCGCSALLFTLVTYHIIDRITERHNGFEEETMKIPCLFYADDGLILGKSRKEIEEMMDTIEISAKECGLELNKRKCKILAFNTEDNIRIREVEIVQKLKYLGVLIENKRMWYKAQIKQGIETGTKINNFLYSIIGKTCNKLMVGKVFWKNVALPRFMFGQEILPYTNAETEQLKRLDNKAYRTILGLPIYTAEEFLRGEVGASSMEARDIKNKLLYYKYAAQETENELLKEVMEREKRYKTKWYKRTERYKKKIRYQQRGSVTKEQETNKRNNR